MRERTSTVTRELFDDKETQIMYEEKEKARFPVFFEVPSLQRGLPHSFWVQQERGVVERISHTQKEGKFWVSKMFWIGETVLW